MPVSSESHLRRRAYSRLLGPDWFQFVAVGVLVLYVFAIVVAAAAIGSGVPAATWIFAVLVAVFVMAGVSGSARVGPDELRWRLRLPVRVEWSTIERIELTAAKKGRFYPGGQTRLRPAVRLIKVHITARAGRPSGRARVIAPAVRAGRAHERAFTLALLAQANSHSTAVEVTRSEWHELLREAAPELLPGDSRPAD